MKSTQVKHIAIPNFEGLAIKDLLNYATMYLEVMMALPVPEEINKLPRQYIANITYTLVGQPFYTWVDRQITARNEKVMAEKNMMIEMDDKVAAIFKESTAVPSKWRGKSRR